MAFWECYTIDDAYAFIWEELELEAAVVIVPGIRR